MLEQDESSQITNFDALTYAGNLDNLEGLDRKRHRFVRGDITNREAVLAALEEETGVIINFAAESHVDRSIISADEFLRTNILGTQVLLDAARERRVNRFLQVSTDEVMGSLPEDENAYFTENSAFAPHSPYANFLSSNFPAGSIISSLQVFSILLTHLSIPRNEFIRMRPSSCAKNVVNRPISHQMSLGWV